MRKIFIAAAVLSICACTEKNNLPKPTEEQLEWQDMEMNMFCHFGPNTFTGNEWGDGTEAEDIFNPGDLDCRQWAAIAKAAGFKGIIITAKHHDGFCLWPSPVSTHTVAQSSWRDGKGDVLAELSAACREYGLKFGVYISPWDRNDPHYGTPEYNDVFVKTLESVHGGTYGPIFEQWFDGANGEGPNGRKQEYDWPLFNSTVLRYNPQAIIFGDGGPGCRWVGNEEGHAGRTCWGMINADEVKPGDNPRGERYLNEGDPEGTHWVPAETDVSIRPGWFWRESENGSVKSVEQLLKIYYESVGRNSLLLLNVPPDATGRINAADSVRLMEFRAALDEIFAEDLAARASVRRKGDCWTLSMKEPVTFNRVVLKEDIAAGQKIAAFTVEALDEDGSWTEIASETTIGHKRIVPVGVTSTRGIRISVNGTIAPKCSIRKPELYLDRVLPDM